MTLWRWSTITTEKHKNAMEVFPSADTYAHVEDIFTPFNGSTGTPTENYIDLATGPSHEHWRAHRHQQQHPQMRRARFSIQSPARPPSNAHHGNYTADTRVSEVRSGAPDPLNVTGPSPATTGDAATATASNPQGVARSVTKVGDIATYIFIVAPGLFCAMILTQAYTVWPSDIVFFLVAVLAAVIFYYITHVVYIAARYHTNRDWTDGQIRICNFISGTLLLVPIYYVVRMIVNLVGLPDITPEQIFLVIAAFVVASAYLTTILARGDD